MYAVLHTIIQMHTYNFQMLVQKRVHAPFPPLVRVGGDGLPHQQMCSCPHFLLVLLLRNNKPILPPKSVKIPGRCLECLCELRVVEMQQNYKYISLSSCSSV